MVRTLLAVVLLVFVVAEAWAKCPYGTAYRCYQGYGGKVVCGCS